MRKKLLAYWWVPIVLLSLSMTSILPSSIEMVLQYAALILLPGSWGLLVLEKQWKKLLGSLTISLAVFVVLGFVSLFNSTDDFGREHPIPKGLAYNVPIDNLSNKASVDSTQIDSFLQIYEGGQGGIYFYDFCYYPLTAGDIFLRCFEVTDEIALSVERIEKASKVSIGGAISFSQYVSGQMFTIYEGDWTDYYASRIEVWHRDAETGVERKLMEKIYRVEGWMR